MANFKGFKQVRLETYQQLSPEEKKNFLWLVREFSGDTQTGAAIYFGTRKYADITKQAEDPRVGNLLATLGGFVDENGEWVGFLPVEEHSILGNSGVTSVSDALSALEAAILENQDAILGKVSQTEYDEKVAEIESSINEISAVTEANESAISELTSRVEGVEGAVAQKADKSELDTLSGSVETIAAELAETTGQTDEIKEALSALTEIVDTKANAEDVYSKNETYNKEEIDAKVAGAFKFKGDAEAISEDETTITVNGEQIVASEENVGFVYQIGDAEYASNGEKWVKLGFNIDLSRYATKDFVESAISAETEQREALAQEVELVQSALTKEIEERQALGQTVDELGDSATITATTYSEAEQIENLKLGRIVYVTESEEISGITYGSGAYINTQTGLRKLDSTTPSTSTTIEERVEILENKVGSSSFSGSTITEAIAELQNEHVITGDDVEE